VSGVFFRGVKWPGREADPTLSSFESVYGKAIGKVHPRTGHEGTEREYRYISTLSLTSALPCLFDLRKKKDSVVIVEEAGWAADTVLPPVGFDPRTVKSIVDRLKFTLPSGKSFNLPTTKTWRFPCKFVSLNHRTS
jgi:hypothetical protein